MSVDRELAITQQGRPCRSRITPVNGGPEKMAGPLAEVGSTFAAQQTALARTAATAHRHRYQRGRPGEVVLATEKAPPPAGL